MSRNLRNSAAQLSSQAANLRPGILLASGVPIAAYSISPQIVTSSVVVVDTQLSVGLNLTGYWIIELLANISIANAAHNIRWTFSAPDGLVLNTTGGVNGATLGRSTLSITGVASQEDPILNVGTTINGGTTSAWTSITARMGVQVTSPGTMMFQFGQGVSGASNTQLLGGSVLRAQYVMNNLGV